MVHALSGSDDVCVCVYETPACVKCYVITCGAPLFTLLHGRAVNVKYEAIGNGS